MKIWYYLSKALGSKEGKDDSEACIVAFMHLFLIFCKETQKALISSSCGNRCMYNCWCDQVLELG